MKWYRQPDGSFETGPLLVGGETEPKLVVTKVAVGDWLCTQGDREVVRAYTHNEVKRLAELQTYARMRCSDLKG
jgi:hypothetical protein